MRRPSRGIPIVSECRFASEQGHVAAIVARARFYAA